MVTRLAALAFVVALASAGPASAAVSVTHFSVNPSTTEAGGHPNLNVSVALGDPAAGVKDLALHLPAGLSADPRAAPFCARKRLLADLCPTGSRIGALAVTGEAFGFRLTVTRQIHNVRPLGAERLRLAVPIYGSLSRPGAAAELPVTERPQDRGLDMAVTGLPREVGGTPIQLHAVTFRIKGLARYRARNRWRRKAFLTNPSTCAPAISSLEVTAHDGSATAIASSSFAPTGCGAR